MLHIGIDMGGTNIAVGVVTEDHRIIGRGGIKTNLEQSDRQTVLDMAAAARLAVQDAGVSMDEIADVGMAVPGSVDPEQGIVSYANNVPFRNTPVSQWMRQELGLPCYIENDANTAAYGELLAGAGRGAKNFVMITLGTGVGGGVIIDGKIYRGFNHAGGELGHMIIVKDGQPCTCGTKGCYEAYASATALIRQTRAAMERAPHSKMWDIANAARKVSGRTAFDAMRAGDEAARQVVEDYIGYVACGLISLVNIFQPEFIAIGGGICNEGETLLAPLRQAVADGDFNKDLPRHTRICKAALGNDAGIVGGAGLYRLF